MLSKKCKNLLTFLCLLCASNFVAAQAPNNKFNISDSDFAILTRSSFGVGLADVEKYTTQGRWEWLRDQLHYVGDNCLPQDVRTTIKSLQYQNYSPKDKFKEEREVVERYKNNNEKDQLKIALKEYRQLPVEEAFERKTLRALYCDNPLQEKLADFWFNHFNVYARKAAVAVFLPDYEESAIRPNMFGSFESLLLATLTHPAMLEYLDNVQNGKDKINENYAREIMELHTLGVDGGYSQTDVQELARILTGVGQNFNDNRGAQFGRNNSRETAKNIQTNNGFMFNMSRHDTDKKVFLNETYSAGGDFNEVKKAVHQLALHPSTARYLSYKMANYFVSDNPPESLIKTMTSAYLNSKGNLAELTKAMVMSKEFSDPVLTKFKEPQAYVYSAIKLQYGTDVIKNIKLLQKFIADLGQPTYSKLTPNGYSYNAADWASADQIGKRFDVARKIVSAPGILFTKKSMEDETPDNNLRQKIAQMYPSNPNHLWALSSRYENEGLKLAILNADNDKEKRSLVIAAPEFMKR